jgi:putative PEP-CTERM system histidine kinase
VNAVLDNPAAVTIAEWAFWGYGSAAAGYAVLALLLMMSWRAKRLRAGSGMMLVAAAAASMLWSASTAAGLVGMSGARVASFVLEAVRDASWIGFIGFLLFRRRRKRPNLDDAAPAAVSLSSVIDSLPVLVKVGIASVGLVLACEIAQLMAISLVTPAIYYGSHVLLSIVALMLVEQIYRGTAPDDRWSIKFFCLGVGAIFAYDLAAYADAMLFRRVDFELWAARGFANLLTIPLIAVSAARNPQWSLDIAVSRRMVFQSTALLSAGTYLLIVSAAGYYIRFFGGTWGGVLQTTVVFAGLVGLGLLLVSGSLRARLKVFINKNFFSYRYDYREEWLRLTRELTEEDRDASFGARAIRAMAHLVEARGGGLWVRQDQPRYERSTQWEAPLLADASEAEDGDLARFLRDREWVINLDEYRLGGTTYGDLRLPSWLTDDDEAWLVVPLMLHDQLFGFIVLLTARTRVSTNWEVNDLLKTAGRQIASTLAQLHANRALIVARQFESFNRMSAFVVHDLKNLVAQLSLLLSNAVRHRDNPEFQDDMIDTVANAVEKMKKLLLQLRVGATPADEPAPVDLQEVVLSALKSKAPMTPRPTILVDAPGIRTMAHRERLDRVVGHLLQNAAEATPATGKIEVRVRAQDHSAIIEVEDSGVGMSEDFIRTRLFKPFESTKKNGMGIGIYESREYIRELGGQLDVQSRETEGTRFSIALPLLRPAALA